MSNWGYTSGFITSFTNGDGGHFVVGSVFSCFFEAPPEALLKFKGSRGPQLISPQLFFHPTESPNLKKYLEDHPRTCKYIVSNPYL